jgi:putative glycosyltransferase (TIGR04372 family)
MWAASVETGKDHAAAALVPNSRSPTDRRARFSVAEPARRLLRPAVRFVSDQVAKTIKHPIRLILIPYRYLLRLPLVVVGHFGAQIAQRVAGRLGNSTWKLPPPLAALEAQYQYYRGWRLLCENKPEQAWAALAACVRHSNDDRHFTVAGLCLSVGLGRMGEAIKLYQQSNRIRRQRAARIGADQYQKYCLLDGFWSSHIGHTANIDYVVKQRIMEGCNPGDTILYVPPSRVTANPFLVRQWQPHLRLLTDPRDLPFPEACVRFTALDFYVPSVTGTGRSFLWEQAAQAYRRWAAEGRGPLLQLPQEVRGRGRNALASVGVPRDAWFVGLHVREPSFSAHHRDLHGVLNADINDYLPAIHEIARRGGWVIRLGDPSMTPLRPLPNVLDYCHSPIRSDWMDVFLAASSRFFIGTSSGVCYVAQDYGVPCVLTNWWPPAQRPWHAGDIFIPKVMRRMRSAEMLSLEETLNEPFGYCNSVRYLRERCGVTVEDNDPDDIRSAVVEMFERLDGMTTEDESDRSRRRCAEDIYASTALRLYDSPAAFGAAVPARDFLRRHPQFVGGGAGDHVRQAQMDTARQMESAAARPRSSDLQSRSPHAA